MLVSCASLLPVTHVPAACHTVCSCTAHTPGMIDMSRRTYTTSVLTVVFIWVCVETGERGTSDKDYPHPPCTDRCANNADHSQAHPHPSTPRRKGPLHRACTARAYVAHSATRHRHCGPHNGAPHNCGGQRVRGSTLHLTGSCCRVSGEGGLRRGAQAQGWRGQGRSRRRCGGPEQEGRGKTPGGWLRGQRGCCILLRGKGAARCVM